MAALRKSILILVEGGGEGYNQIAIRIIYSNKQMESEISAEKSNGRINIEWVCENEYF
jgi:hypothetical protein